MTLRLLTYNIRRGGVGREARLAAVIRRTGADLVVLQEATRPEVVRRLAEASGLPVWGARQGHSLAFLSRVPVASPAWLQPPGSRHAFLDLVAESCSIRVFGLHLSAVHAAWTERRRMGELRALLDAIREHQSGFHLLAGDFNTLAPGELLDVRALPYRLRALMWLSGGEVRWRTIQAVLDAGYVDAFRTMYPDDTGFTFPVWNPHVRLDYVFVPKGYSSRLVRCTVVRDEVAPTASDHFPVLAELNV